MKKIIYSLILPLLVACGLVFANREIKNLPSKKLTPKAPNGVPLSAVESQAVLKKWEASPDGIKYLKWKASPAGKKVQAGTEKISKSIRDYTNMEGVVTSLTLPLGSRLGFGIMVKINNEDYILAFGAEQSDKKGNNEFEQLHSLKVNDKLIIKSHNVSHAPKYSYPIVAGDYIERDNKIIFKRTPRKGGC